MKQFVLVILDGFGFSEKTEGNAVKAAGMKFYDSLTEKYPHSLLEASGESVGMPEGFQGTSEIGHLHIGAGRIVPQLEFRIDKAIADRSFYRNEVFLQAMDNCRKNNSALHLLGMVSDAAVHSHLNHLFALMKLAKEKKLGKVFLHCILDGRDVPEKSAEKYINLIKEKIKELGIGRIASLCGRYYAMDRNNDFHLTQEAYDLLVSGKGFQESNALLAVKNAYARGERTDYYVKPISLAENGKPVALIKENDSVIFWNFRSDRARQLTYAFIKNDFNEFPVKKMNLFFACMAEYDTSIKLNAAFRQLKIENNLAQVLSFNGLTQLKVAETQKYAHLTFFFNSQIEEPVKGEERIHVKSKDVPSFDLAPEMSAKEITEIVLENIENEKFDVIMVNFANADLVGHSGNFDAVVKALKVLDESLRKIVEKALQKKGALIITSDHGNAEEMFYENKLPKPSHTMNPVPFILVSNEEKLRKAKLRNGFLFDVAPTILMLLKLSKPKEMTGKSLIEGL